MFKSQKKRWHSVIEIMLMIVLTMSPAFGQTSNQDNSPANPKSSTKEPITLDAILVCKKSSGIYEQAENIIEAIKGRH